MQISIGLDIGQDAVKGVRIARSLRGLRLIDSFERKVPKEKMGSLTQTDLLGEGQIEILKELISERKIRPGEGVAVSLPGQLVSSREMTLPFIDPKKLRQTVPYEVEGQLPFDIEEVSIAYQILYLDHGPPPSSRLLVSTVPKGILRKYLNTLQMLGIDPAWVTIDPIPLYTFYQYFLSEKGRNRLGPDHPTELLMIDIGASKTVLCDIQMGSLNWVRTVPMGGDFLTEALQKEFDLSWEEAERLKEEVDLNKAGEGPYQGRAVECIQNALAPWLTEIEKSLRLIKRPPVGTHASLHLCGGGAALKGLKEILCRTLEMEPVSWGLLEASCSSSVAGLERPLKQPLLALPPEAKLQSLQTPSMAHLFVQGIGLALPPTDGSQINFRQGEFVFGKETIEKRNRLVSIGLVFLLLLGLMGGDLYLRYYQKERHYQELKGRLREEFVQIFPQAKNVANEVEQMRAAIVEINRSGDFLGVGEESPLEVLKELTAGIPMEVRIDVQELVIDGNKVRIEAQTDSYDSVDRIRAALLKVGHFQEVSVSDAKVAADQSRVGFRIQVSVKERGKRERKGSS